VPFPFPFVKHVRVFPAREVTTVGAEADPQAAGLSARDIEAMWQAVVRLYETGLHPAIALCVRRRGLGVLDRAIGHVRGNAPGARSDGRLVRATPDTLFNLYSASKAVTAMLVHLLDERGLVHLDDPVAEYLPEFGKNGKEWITLRHVLTHRAGIPSMPAEKVGIDQLIDPRRLFEMLCQVRPLAPFGRHLGYHAITGGVVIAAVIERVTGRDIRSFLRSEVLDPLGFRHLSYGVEKDEVDLVAESAVTGPPALPPYSWLLQRSLGASLEEVVKISNDPRFLTAIVPSANIIGTANEASRYFELLLRGGELEGKRIFGRRTVRRAIAEQTYLEVDSIMALPVRYGMGFMLGGERFSLYGAHTPRAFGHIGFTAVAVYADPDRDISVALMTSGKPFITPGQLRWLDVARTIARHCPKATATAR
jgi:CubicO group peptidase (beta-lactamase class C family)